MSYNNNRSQGNDRLKDYIEVNVRIQKFYEKYPDGSIQTEIVSWENNIVVMKAYAYRTPEDPRPATGHAYEVEGSSQVNRTSALENCETSAVGRALALLGFEIKKSVASREEVANAIHQQENGNRQPHVDNTNQSLHQQTYSEHEQIPGTDGVLVEHPDEEPTDKVKALWKLLKKVNPDGCHAHFNKQRKIGFSPEQIERELARRIKMPASIGEIWAQMYIDDKKMLDHGPVWYIEKRLSGMSDDEIESGLANAIANKAAKAGA